MSKLVRFGLISKIAHIWLILISVDPLDFERYWTNRLDNSGLEYRMILGVPIDKSKRSNISHFAAHFAKFDQF